VSSIVPAVMSQDHDALAKIFADDLAFHLRGPVPSAGDYAGVGGLLEGIGGLIELAPDIDLDQQFCIGTDGWAAEFEHATLGRNGSSLVSKNAFVYRFDGDRIAEMWMFLGAPPEQAAAFLA
jgi:hypothetical protein